MFNAQNVTMNGSTRGIRTFSLCDAKGEASLRDALVMNLQDRYHQCQWVHGHQHE